MSRAKRLDFVRIQNQARELRSKMTDSEKLLWEELKGRKLNGYRFLRQHPVLYKGNLIRYNYFIADFFCYQKKAIIEVDGPVHEESREYDEFRDAEMEELGFNILRIRNDDLNNKEVVLERIRSFLESIR